MNKTAIERAAELKTEMLARSMDLDEPGFRAAKRAWEEQQYHNRVRAAENPRDTWTTPRALAEKPSAGVPAPLRRGQ